MAQATLDPPRGNAQSADLAVNTDELLSQLADNEIDRLLAESDGNAPPAKPAPPEDAAPSTTEAGAPAGEKSLAEGDERAALLQAAGFDASDSPSPSPTGEVKQNPPTGEERSALLEAAGFESPDSVPDSSPTETPSPSPDAEVQVREHKLPIYLKPLIWANAPLDKYPQVVRKMLGAVGIVTLLNAIAVLVYTLVIRKH